MFFAKGVLKIGFTSSPFVKSAKLPQSNSHWAHTFYFSSEFDP